MMSEDTVTMNFPPSNSRARIAILLVLLATAGLGACSHEDRSQISDSGVIRVGTDATFPPFEWHDTATGNVVGFDVDLARAVFGRLGYTVEVIAVALNDLIPELNAGTYDVVLSAYTITADRNELALFSLPYYETGLAIVTAIDDSSLTGIADLVGKRVGVQRGSTGERLGQRIFRAEVFSYDSIGQAFRALEEGSVHAVLNDRPTSALYVTGGGRARLVDGMIERERYAAAFRKSDAWLKEKFDSALAEYMATPSFEQLLQRYGLRAEDRLLPRTP